MGIDLLSNSKTKLFSQEQLSKIIGEQISAEEQATHVVVGTVDLSGAQVVASFKKRQNASFPTGFAWELQAAARHEWAGDNSVGAKVILKW